MHVLKIIAVAASALPALAAAQVGPNPMVSGGSQDPTVGASSDSVTAPQDAKVGAGASGNVLDRSIGGSASDTMTDGGAEAAAKAAQAATTPTPTSDSKVADDAKKAAKKSPR